MSKHATNTATGRSAIAITQEESNLKAVELRKQDDALEVLWTKSGKTSNGDWSSFAAECGLSTTTTKRTKVSGDKVGVVGFDSTGVAFYRIDAPAVGEDEVEAIVKIQAETMLPLPAEEMELAWRRGPVQDGKAAITVAAARKESLQTLVDNVRGFEPARILLDCEAIVRAWTEFFSGIEKENALVTSLTARSTLLCLVEDGHLSNATVLDIGLEDYLRTRRNLPGTIELAEQTEITERLSQDIRSILESYGYSEYTMVPISVLSDGSDAIKGIVSSLKSAGFNATVATPEVKNLRVQREFEVAQLYEYRLPVGLALMALDTPAVGLDLFANLYKPASLKKKRSGLYPLKITGAIAAALLVALAIVSYGVDVASEKRLSRLAAEPQFKELVERQALIENVARQRPDLLQLLNDISSGENNRGIQLDSFYFRKAQPITISGDVQNNDQLYDFQKYLLSKKGITDVNIQNTSRDSRTKRLRFTITFHYKTFTKKSTRA
jgi:Tfp pilus assembly protein PilN